MKLLYFSVTLFFIPSLIAKVKNSTNSKGNSVTTLELKTMDRPDVPFNSLKSCEEFGRFAKFNPHSVLEKKWFVFYYWSLDQKPQLYQFLFPNKLDRKVLHRFLDGHMPKRFSWNSTLLLKRELVTNFTTLLEEKGDRGQYLEYGIFSDIPKGKLTFFRSIRIKQTGDNKYLAIVSCRENTAIVMSPLSGVPPQGKLYEEAARMGFRERKGKSYLYQGHERMPIPEMDETEYWIRNRHLKRL